MVNIMKTITLNGVNFEASVVVVSENNAVASVSNALVGAYEGSYIINVDLKTAARSSSGVLCIIKGTKFVMHARGSKRTDPRWTLEVVSSISEPLERVAETFVPDVVDNSVPQPVEGKPELYVVERCGYVYSATLLKGANGVNILRARRAPKGEALKIGDAKRTGLSIDISFGHGGTEEPVYFNGEQYLFVYAQEVAA